jgi:hypothetical protein
MYLGLSVALIGGSCAKYKLAPKNASQEVDFLDAVGLDMQKQYRTQFGYKRNAMLIDVDFSKAKK